MPQEGVGGAGRESRRRMPVGGRRAAGGCSLQCVMDVGSGERGKSTSSLAGGES